MARPSQMAPRMQVQSAIASPPACGRVCAHLSCLVLHARTLRLSQPAWLRRPFAPAAAPLSLLPRNRWQAAAATRARRARRNPRARARGGWVHWGGDELMPPSAATHGTRGRREVAARGSRQAADRGQANRSAERRSARERLLDPRALMEHPQGESGRRAPKVCVCCVCVLGSRRCTMPMERACKPVVGCFVSRKVLSAAQAPPTTLS